MASEPVDFGLVLGRDSQNLHTAVDVSCGNASFTQWLMVNRGMSPYNAKHESQRLGKVIRAYGEVTSTNVEQIASLILSSNAANGTKRHYLFVLEAWLEYLGFSIKFRKPKVGKRSPHYLNQSQLSVLIRAARDYREYAILATFIFSGARLNEVRMLNWLDVDFPTQKIVVRHAKLDKEREIPMAPELERVLLAYRARLPTDSFGPSQPVFNSIRGNRISNHALASIVSKAGDRAGVKVHPHALRHSFATAWAANGGDVFHLKEILGHSDIHMTERYWHVCDDSRREAFKRGTPRLDPHH